MSGCILCGQTPHHVITPPPELGGVSSDIKPHPRNFPLHICAVCGHVQKPITAEWQQVINEIYADYAIYHLADGAEQVIFQDDTAQARSARLLSHLLRVAPPKEQGVLLDVGCGNGAMLRSAARLLPNWRLFGQEITEQFRTEVEKIPNVEQLFVGDLNAIEGKFDLITLLHVLEHIPEPVAFLATLRQKLTPDGLLLIQVPAFMDNPYDLLVVDHASHFMPATLTQLAARAGFAPIAPADYWIAKEISLLLQPVAEPPINPDPPMIPQVVAGVGRRVKWLTDIAQIAREIAGTQLLGVFGTATGGTWLGGITDVDFFVDEDTLKAGHTHLDRPIYAPATAPGRSCVYLALAPILADQVFDRLQPAYPTLRFIRPPELETP